MENLTLEQVISKAPAVQTASRLESKTSEKYRHVSTLEVIDTLAQAGYAPVQAGQVKTRNVERVPYARQLLRFRHTADTSAGDITPEIICINSHDGTSAFKVMLGFFRFACANGLIVSEGTLASFAIRHSGGADFNQSIIQAVRSLSNSIPAVMNTVNAWRNIQLTREQQLIYAADAIRLHQGDNSAPVREYSKAQLLQPRRHADVAINNTLWGAFNIVQENMLKGRFLIEAPTGLRYARKITSINRNTEINRGLWELTQITAGRLN